MRIAVIHDYADLFRTTPAYSRLAAHEVVIHTDAYKDPDKVVVNTSRAQLIAEGALVAATHASIRARSSGCLLLPKAG